jgi:hypothetical protein
MASVPSMASTARTMPCAGLADVGAAEGVDDGGAAGDVGAGLGVGRGFRQQAGRSQRLGEDVMRAENTKTFLAEDADDGGEQAVIAGEGGGADAGDDAGAFGVGAQGKQGRSADRADQHQVAAAVFAQGAEDFAGGAEAAEAVRIGRDDRGDGESVESDDEDAAAASQRRGGDLAGQRPAASENSQRRVGHRIHLFSPSDQRRE